MQPSTPSALKKKTNSFGVLLFIVIAIATSSASSDIEIYAFDQNPAGRDEGNEWITLYNPSNQSVDIGNWTLETADGERETIPEGTNIFTYFNTSTYPYAFTFSSLYSFTKSNTITNSYTNTRL